MRLPVDAKPSASHHGISEDTYKHAGEPKELYIVPGAGHVDLYDRVNLIPWNKLVDFLEKTLKQDSSSIAAALAVRQTGSGDAHLTFAAARSLAGVHAAPEAALLLVRANDVRTWIDAFTCSTDFTGVA